MYCHGLVHNEQDLWDSQRIHDELLAVLLLTDADDDDDETDALAFAQLVLAMKKQSFLSGGGRYGMRGEYREPKSKDFFDLLMYQFSERWFKAWLR